MAKRPETSEQSEDRAGRRPRRQIGRLGMIGLDLPVQWMHRSAYAPVLTGALAGAADAGLDVHLVTLDTGPLVDQLAWFASEDRADGVLVLASGPLTPGDLAPLGAAGMPYVLVDRHFAHLEGGPPVSCVTPDWATATRDLVERLHAFGHRQIAALFPDDQTSTALDYRTGWTQGVSRSRFAPETAPILAEASPRMGSDSGLDIGRRLLTQGLPGTGQRPTAIVAFDDHVAHGVLRAAQELDLAIPQQVSIMGFDDTIGRYLSPPLCSYDPHFYDVGQQAVTLLAAALTGGAEAARPRRVMVPLEFVHRGTCAPVL